MYRLLQQLDDQYVVFHSREWITRIPQSEKPEGEIDFLIAHAHFGLLVLEVKGGGIRVERNRWYSIDAHGIEHSIKNPFLQAEASEYALKTWLEQHPQTRRYRFPIHRAIVFPDVEVDTNDDLSTNMPRDIIIDRNQLEDLPKTISRVYAYWHARYRHGEGCGQAGLDALTRLLEPSKTLRTRISFRFEDEERQIKQLTESQFSLLSRIRAFRRAVIIGGAGTGKTMLALEKVRQLAEDGKRTLLLCFNTNLARWLSEVTDSQNSITVMTYHALAVMAYESWARIGKVTSWKENEFFTRAPFLLGEALDQIHADPEATKKYLFDAVIIDEGQDFNEDFWVPVEDLLRNPREGILYICLDQNQRIYTSLSNLPISKDQPPFYLDENCRNTQQIFSVLQTYARDDNRTKCIGPKGETPEFLPAATPEAAIRALQAKISELADVHGISPSYIVVLTPRKQGNSLWNENMQVGRHKLTWNLESTSSDYVQVATIHSFKGLERPVVILTELDAVHSETLDELLYVGISRARNQLIVIGSMPKA